MADVNINNPSLYLNSQRTIQAGMQKKVIEQALDESVIQNSPTVTREIDSDIVSWMALDQHLLLGARNIKIISPVEHKPVAKSELICSSVVAADGTQSTCGTMGSENTSGSGVVAADGTQSAGGIWVSGTGRTSDVNSTNVANETTTNSTKSTSEALIL